LQVKSLLVKNFRCFESLTLDLDSQLVLLSGPNGIGKTSILEALHYGCYLRSFRTHLPRELILFGSQNFYIQLKIQAVDSTQHDLQVGFQSKKKLVKVDQKSVQSYKDLTEYYRVVSVMEDDLLLIKGGPDVRRSFLDQALSLEVDDYINTLRKYKKILQQKNAVLQHNTVSYDMYVLWSEKLWHYSQQIKQHRIDFLNEIQKITNKLLREHFSDSYTLILKYLSKKITNEPTFKDFISQNKILYEQEKILKRSLFGAHLDDISIKFQNKTSRSYASRGQQKLILILLKIAQLHKVSHNKGSSIFLLDDFMTDFDEATIDTLLEILLKLNAQIIFTCPTTESYLHDRLLSKGAIKRDICSMKREALDK